MKSVLMAALAVPAFAVFLAAHPQTGAARPMPSLGDLARKLSAGRKTQSAKPANVFTNDNIPHHGGITVTGTPTAATEANPVAERDIPCQERSLAWQFPQLYYTLHSPPAREEATSHGRTRQERHQTIKEAFKRACPCPSTGKVSGACPGYIVDHINPLACGGADSPDNMAWQTVADSKAKDKWERRGCK